MQSASWVGSFYPALLIAGGLFLLTSFSQDFERLCNLGLRVFVTMSVGPGELYVQIENIYNDLSTSSRLDDSKRVAEALVSSKRNFELWHNTWLGNASDPTARSERLWGKNGWVNIQDIFAEMEER